MPKMASQNVTEEESKILEVLSCDIRYHTYVTRARTIVSMTSRVYGMVVVVGVDVILFKTGLLDLTSTLSLTTYDVSNDTIYPKL